MIKQKYALSRNPFNFAFSTYMIYVRELLASLGLDNEQCHSLSSLSSRLNSFCMEKIASRNCVVII